MQPCPNKTLFTDTEILIICHYHVSLKMWKSSLAHRLCKKIDDGLSLTHGPIYQLLTENFYSKEAEQVAHGSNEWKHPEFMQRLKILTKRVEGGNRLSHAMVTNTGLHLSWNRRGLSLSPYKTTCQLYDLEQVSLNLAKPNSLSCKIRNMMSTLFFVKNHF